MTVVDAPAPELNRAVPVRSTALVAIGLGFITLAVSSLGSWIPSLWGDEATSVLSAERSVPSLFWMLGRVDAVHGSYYLFLHFWVDLFGASPYSVRFPSAIGAGIAVAGIVFLATRLVNLRTGIFAGIVCIALPRVTYMGEEARGYAFSAALIVWLTYLLVRVLQDPDGGRRYWVFYSVGMALCGYVFLFSLLILPAHAIVVRASAPRDTARRWAKWAALGVALSLPIITLGFLQRSQIGFLTDRNAATFGSVFIGQWFGNPWCALFCWAALIGSIVVAIIARRRRGERTPQLLPGGTSAVLVGATWLLVPASILLTINFVDPVYSSRYLTFAVPAAALLIGVLFARIRPLAIGIALLVALIVLALPSYLADRTPYAKNSSDWAAVAELIKQKAHPGDGMLFDEAINPSKRPRLGMRVYPEAYVGLIDIALKKPWWQTDYWSDSTYALDEVPQRLAAVSTIWLTEYRAPGSQAYDTTNESLLTALGFSRVALYELHSDVVIELRRP